MDLPLIARLTWRFRRLLVAGALLALLLAAATAFKVTMTDGSPKVEHRQKEMWVSYGRLLVTQAGFPQGRSDLGGEAVPELDAGQAARGEGEQEFAQPGRFIEMAPLYARLAQSEPVRKLIFEKGPIQGADSVTVVAQEEQPLLEISATADSRLGAIALAQRQMEALRTYLAREQRDNEIAPENRITLNVIERPGAPALLAEQSNTWVIAPRSPIKPALVFLTVIALFFGLAIVLENVNPRLRRVGVEGEPAAVEDTPKRSNVRSA